MDTRIELPMITSFVTIALAILVIGVFIYFGANAVFYSMLLIAIIFGFLNGWIISRYERARAKAPQARYTRIPGRAGARKRGRK